MVSCIAFDGLGTAKHPAQPRSLKSCRDSSPVPKTRILLSLRIFNKDDEIKKDPIIQSPHESTISEWHASLPSVSCGPQTPLTT